MKGFNRRYNKEKEYVIIDWICESCKILQTSREQKFLKKIYPYCHKCYQKSPERKITARKHPNFRGFFAKICRCGKNFVVRNYRQNSAKYCSNTCRYKFHCPKAKFIEYGGIRFRSSWEVRFAQYLDKNSLHWKYEPEGFGVLNTTYWPDFWVEEWKTYVEVKGYFRKDAESKYNEFAKTYPVILADKQYLQFLGISTR